jgi:hypothetical protein
LTSDEVRRFKILSNRFKAEDEKKLIVLFDTIRSEKYAGEEHLIVSELYEANNAQTRNRYYRLRNKLLENIEKSLVFYHFKYKDSIHAYYDIQLSIMFRERGAYQLSLYFLKKAERKARDLDQFNILEQIYQEYTQLAIKDIEINIEEILERRKSNLEKVRIQRRNTEAIALITQQLKKSNFSKDRDSVIDLLEKTRKHIEKTAEIFHSSEGRIQIFRTVSALLLQKEAFDQLASYTEKTIGEFEQAGLFNNDNHSERLLMRLWLVNSLFKTMRLAEASTQLETFEKEMSMYRKQNYFTYLFHFLNTKINVAKCLGNFEEAADLIREGLAVKELRSEPSHETFLMRSQADLQFLTGDYKGADETVQGIKKLAGYRLLNEDAAMYLDIFQFVLRLELGDHEFISQNFKPLCKTYKKALKNPLHERINIFLEILEKLNKAADKGKKANIGTLSENLKAHFPGNEPGGNEIFLYDLFVEAKAKDQSYASLFVSRMKQLAIG